MLAHIAETTEPHNAVRRLQDALKDYEREGEVGTVDLIALSVAHTLRKISPSALLVPTTSGSTARNISRFRLPVWIRAFSSEASTCQTLQFSYGVHPVFISENRPDWAAFARRWLRQQGIGDGVAALTQGPSHQNPSGNHRMEILELNPRSLPQCDASRDRF